VKVYIVTHGVGDWSLVNLSEGWLNSGAIARGEIEVCIWEPQSHIKPDPTFWDTIKTADVVLYTNQKGTRGQNFTIYDEIATKHDLWKHTVVLDGSEVGLRRCWVAEPLVAKAPLTLIGRHYLYAELKAKGSPVEFFPRMGLDDRVTRYRRALPWQMWKDIPATYPGDWPIGPYEHYRHIQKVVGEVIPEAIVGPIHGTYLQPSYTMRSNGRHDPFYYEMVSRARVFVRAYAYATSTCDPFWDAVGMECALLYQDPASHPFPEMGGTDHPCDWEFFEPKIERGKDIEMWSTEAELRAKLKAMVDDPARCERMATSVWEKIQPYRSIPRSQKLLDYLRKYARS